MFIKWTDGQVWLLEIKINIYLTFQTKFLISISRQMLLIGVIPISNIRQSALDKYDMFHIIKCQFEWCALIAGQIFHNKIHKKKSLLDKVKVVRPLGLGTRWGLQIYACGASEPDVWLPLRYVTGRSFSFLFLKSFIMSRIPSQIIESTIWYESCKYFNKTKVMSIEWTW